MKYKIEDLRDDMMDVIRGVKNGTIDIEKAKAIADVGQVIINSAKVEVEFMKTTGGTGSGFMENTGRRPALKSVAGDAA